MLDNTLSANYKYSRINRENLPLPNSTKLSKKPSNFYLIVFVVLESKLNFRCFEKKNEPDRSSISKIIDSVKCACLNA